jgi:hypothetical protein
MMIATYSFPYGFYGGPIETKPRIELINWTVGLSGASSESKQLSLGRKLRFD